MNLLANTEADLMVVDTFAELNSDFRVAPHAAQRCQLTREQN